MQLTMEYRVSEKGMIRLNIREDNYSTALEKLNRLADIMEEALRFPYIIMESPKVVILGGEYYKRIPQVEMVIQPAEGSHKEYLIKLMEASGFVKQIIQEPIIA